MKLSIVIVIFLCFVVSEATGHNGAPAIESKATKIKYMMEWFAMRDATPTAPTTEDPELKFKLGRNPNAPPLGSKFNPDIKLAPHPYLSKPIVKFEAKSLEEYLRLRRYHPRNVIKDKNYYYYTVPQDVPTSSR